MSPLTPEPAPPSPSPDERDYVLGTHDDEIARLSLQHRVWRPRALDAWRRAGFTTGQTLIDVGCGPGYATIDLAEIAGPRGRVLAVDRSRRFLDTLSAICRARALDQVETVELDLDEVALPELAADGAWARWVLCFVQRPRTVLERMLKALRPGGTLVLHEYFDYSTWRVTPHSPEIEEFVTVVMDSWRARGGEPDIGLQIPRWLDELGAETRALTPIIDVVPASNFVWNWPLAFLRGGLPRLVELGELSAQRAAEIESAVSRIETTPGALMVTPAVLEIIAQKR